MSAGTQTGHYGGSGAARSGRAEPPRALAELAARAGIRFNGPSPWDIRVHDPAVYRRILSRGSLGLGESYMDGQWDTQALDELFVRLLRARLDTRILDLGNLQLAAHAVLNRAANRLLNRQNKRRAFTVGERHYDIGNDLYAAMLDPTMSYSCGYWAKADNLDAAQLDKLDLICRKLELEPGQTLLDVGCGWGGLAEFAARHYGVRVTGITVSREQRQLARERVRGLDVEIALRDYRELQGRFDRIVSVGMFEHVGPANYRRFFRKMRGVLAPDGLFLLHTIGEFRTTPASDPWIDRYIFPNGKLPSPTRITRGFEGLFMLEDWQNFGRDYDRTLMAWWRNFDRAWDGLRGERYDERFYRMWKYYLQSCAGMFRAGRGQLWQLVFSGRDYARAYRPRR